MRQVKRDEQAASVMFRIVSLSSPLTLSAVVLTPSDARRAQTDHRNATFLERETLNLAADMCNVTATPQNAIVAK
ncbi:hypothetical protein Q1695_004762 [Nippostrongylus brasiliensis]|nr:hypothetical protein Q1695_004762 [Nippostrongylus brasiliensis]